MRCCVSAKHTVFEVGNEIVLYSEDVSCIKNVLSLVPLGVVDDIVCTYARMYYSGLPCRFHTAMAGGSLTRRKASILHVGIPFTLLFRKLHTHTHTLEGTNTYGTFLSSHSSGKCRRISSGSASAAMTMNSEIPRFSVLVADAGRHVRESGGQGGRQSRGDREWFQARRTHRDKILFRGAAFRIEGRWPDHAHKHEMETEFDAQRCRCCFSHGLRVYCVDYIRTYVHIIAL